jgi:hypothetical protein
VANILLTLTIKGVGRTVNEEKRRSGRVKKVIDYYFGKKDHDQLVLGLLKSLNRLKIDR